MTARHRFLVDRSDPASPQVAIASPEQLRLAETGAITLKTFAEAKEEIVSHYQRVQDQADADKAAAISHCKRVKEQARAQIARTRLLRLADIDTRTADTGES